LHGLRFGDLRHLDRRHGNDKLFGMCGGPVFVYIRKLGVHGLCRRDLQYFDGADSVN